LKIDRQYKPQLCVSKAPTRSDLAEGDHDLTQVYYDKQSGVCVATNGHLLVTVPVTDENDAAGHIPPSAFVDAVKLDKPLAEVTLAVTSERVTLSNGASVPRQAAGEFPHYLNIMPTFGDDAVSITFSAAYLATIAKALGANKEGAVTLTFNPKDSGPIRVRAVGAYSDKAVGVLMPFRA
jgi:hypothetical protein